MTTVKMRREKRYQRRREIGVGVAAAESEGEKPSFMGWVPICGHDTDGRRTKRRGDEGGNEK